MSDQLETLTGDFVVVGAGPSIYFSTPMFHRAEGNGSDISASSLSLLVIEKAVAAVAKKMQSHFHHPRTYFDPTGNVTPNTASKHMVPRALVEMDLALIEACDLFILNHVNGPSAGSMMETFFAHRELGLPVVTIFDEKTFLSPWVEAHSTYVLAVDPTDVAEDGSWNGYADFEEKLINIIVQERAIATAQNKTLYVREA